MGGVDVTADVYKSDTGVITITSVTGDVVITATADFDSVKWLANGSYIVPQQRTVTSRAITVNVSDNSNVDMVGHTEQSYAETYVPISDLKTYCSYGANQWQMNLTDAETVYTFPAGTVITTTIKVDDIADTVANEQSHLRVFAIKAIPTGSTTIAEMVDLYRNNFTIQDFDESTYPDLRKFGKEYTESITLTSELNICAIAVFTGLQDGKHTTFSVKVTVDGQTIVG
jgi:hypothetical protein